MVESVYPCTLALASSSSRDPVGLARAPDAALCGGRPFLGLSLVCHWSVRLGHACPGQDNGLCAACSVQRAVLTARRVCACQLWTAAATAAATDSGQPLLSVMCLAPAVQCSWLVKKPVRSGIHAALKPRQAQQLKLVHDPNPESQFECPVSTRPSRRQHPPIDTTSVVPGQRVTCVLSHCTIRIHVASPATRQRTRPRLDLT